MERSRRAVLTAVVATAVPLAGCGTDGDDDRPQTTDGTPTSSGETTGTTAASTAGTTADPANATTAADPSPDETTRNGTASDSSTATTPAATVTGAPESTATIAVSTVDALGEILVGPNQRTLYAFDGASTAAGADSCTGGCQNNWPPLTTTETPTAGSDVEASVEAVSTASGFQHITAAGRPLYSFVGDETPGDVRGQGVGGTWWALRPDGSLARE